MNANGGIPRQPHVSTCMYSALFYHFCGRQKKMKTVLLPQLLAVKKAAANQPNYVNYSPKGSRRSLWFQHHTRTHIHFKKKTQNLLVSNLKAASRCFNAGMFINDSSLYCLQANERNIGYRKVRRSHYMEGIKICCRQHIRLQVLNFKPQPPNFFHFLSEKK